MFEPGYTCRTTIIFGTLKNSRLKINRLPLNNCFFLQKRLVKWRQRFVKNRFKKACFCFKNSNFVHLGQYDLVQIPPACDPNA